MNLYEQRNDETPFDWVNRVLKTVAYRMLWAALALFVLGYFVGMK